MNWLQSILYALISGMAEFFPISSHAHEALLLYLFGVNSEPAVLKLFIHIGMLLALFYGARSQLSVLRREYALMKLPKHRRLRQPDRQTVFDISLLKLSVIPLLISFVWYFKTQAMRSELHLVSIFLAVNGLLLHFPMYLPRGNKDSQNITGLDALLFGASGALSVFPGISRIGAFSSVAIARGSDMQQAIKWALFLSFPALAGYICFDIYALFVSGFAGIGFSVLIQSVVCCGFSFLSASAAIMLMRFITVRSGISGFSYYSWGAALFTFILYMTI